MSGQTGVVSAFSSSVAGNSNCRSMREECVGVITFLLRKNRGVTFNIPAGGAMGRYPYSVCRQSFWKTSTRRIPAP